MFNKLYACIFTVCICQNIYGMQVSFAESNDYKIDPKYTIM